MVHDLVTRHEAVGIAADVCAARKLHRPVRRDQAEAVPTIAPGLCDAGPLEDSVLEPKSRQFVTHREAGLTGPHDRYRDPLRNAVMVAVSADGTNEELRDLGFGPFFQALAVASSATRPQISVFLALVPNSRYFNPERGGG